MGRKREAASHGPVCAVDLAQHRGKGTGFQALFEGPGEVGGPPGFRHQQGAWIDAEGGDARAIGVSEFLGRIHAIGPEAKTVVCRADGPNTPGKQGQCKTQCGPAVGMGAGLDFMQAARLEPVPGEHVVDLDETEIPAGPGAGGAGKSRAVMRGGT